MSLTPHNGSKGLFQVKNPYTVSQTKVYTVVAIRSFSDIYEKGGDVFPEYYTTVGLDESVFNADKAANASIVTLKSEDNEFVYVPNTYILAIPDMSAVNYQHLIMSIDFGALPEYVDVEYLQDELATVAGKVIGKVPTVKTHIAKTSGVITPSQHQVLEASRLAAIEFNSTAYARYLEQVRLNGDLTTRILMYEQMLIDAGLVD